MVTVTASHIEEKIFQYNFGYNSYYIEQQSAPLVLMLKNMFTYSICHS